MADTGFRLTTEMMPALREEYWPDNLCELIPQGPAPDVGIIMGSDSDMRVMAHAINILNELGVSNEHMVTSAHRTPEWMSFYGFLAVRRGIKVIVAGAGGSAHLPGDIASHTTLPVLGVAVEEKPDPLNAAIGSIGAMPAEGGPLGLTGREKAGAVNAGLVAARILSLSNPELAVRVEQRMKDNAHKVMFEKHVKIMNMSDEEIAHLVAA